MNDLDFLECEFPEVTFWQSPSHWIHFLSNPAPDMECLPVDNRQGGRYWADVRGKADFPTVFHLYHRGNLVGVMYLEMGLEEDIMRLNELRVADKHAGHGLGTWLLRQAFQVATARRMRIIEGRAVARDAERSPWLLDWYRGHGFTVKPGLPDDKANTVARIEKVTGTKQ